jgi:CRISP-associated protein Cas1
MATFYAIEQGAEIGCNGERLEVHRAGTLIGSAPLIKIDDIVLFGNIGISTPAIKRLLQRGIDVTFLTLDGHYFGRLVGPSTPHVALRQAQYARAASESWSLQQAQAFVSGKLRNQRAVLNRFVRNRSDAPQESAEAADAMAGYLERIGRTTQLGSLLGVEGSATARYFGGLRHLLGEDWQFATRQRRPPPDPVNVLLSFGYTLLAHKVIAAVQAVGLDPYLGFLHRLEYGRPSLALDLMEEFRPILIDSLVLRVCSDGRITSSDFTAGDTERPIIFSDNGKRRFLTAFEERLNTEVLHPIGADSGPGRVTYLRCIELQARQLVRAIRDDRASYTPFTSR